MRKDDIRLLGQILLLLLLQVPLIPQVPAHCGDEATQKCAYCSALASWGVGTNAEEHDTCCVERYDDATLPHDSSIKAGRVW